MATQNLGGFERILRIGEGRRLKRLQEQAAYVPETTRSRQAILLGQAVVAQRDDRLRELS